VANFTAAAIGHAIAGFPTCTDEQTRERLTICRACHLYLPDPDDASLGACAHVSCGCTLRDGHAYLSKLAWSDQSCPIGKWPTLPN
jgi:hypothetical protein